MRFKVSLPSKDNLVFGDEMSIDLILLDGKAFFHFMDSTTTVSNAPFLSDYGETYGQSVE